MVAEAVITARVPAQTKQQFSALARHHSVSESVLLRRLVDAALFATIVPATAELEPVGPVAASGKISVRLQPQDLTFLRERARARQMPTGTYVSLLVRSHLHNLSPLPTEELGAFRRSIAELGAIGRNLNQIARALNSGEHTPGPSSADLQGLLRVLTSLRDQTKALVTTNVLSWEVGYEKKSH